MKRFYNICLLYILTASFNSLQAQCNLNAGSDLYICVNSFGNVDTTTFNANITDPSRYTFKWKTSIDYIGTHFSASNFLDDTTLLNPNIIKDPLKGSINPVFYLTAIDTTNNVECTDSVSIHFSHFASHLGQCIKYINAGDTTNLFSSSVGGIGPLSYSWSPNYNISDINLSEPRVWPDTNTSYQCVVTDSIGCASSFGDLCNIAVSPVGINELENKSLSITVSSNPIVDESFILINDLLTEEYSYQILKIDGKLIQENRLANNPIFIGDHIKKSGIYLFKALKNNRTIATYKLIKQ